MFALSQYLASPSPAGPADSDPSMFRSQVYRFAGSVPDLRLPKDPSALAPVLASQDGASAHSVLAAPVGRIALADSPDGCRRAALVAAVARHDGDVALTSVVITVQRGLKKYDQPELVAASAVSVTDRDAMIDLLAAHWSDALPEARSAGAGAAAVWLGSDPRNPKGALPDAAAPVAAGYGLDLEIVRDVPRMRREVASRLADRPPEYVFVWVPHAAGSDAALAAYERANEEGQVVRLTEAGQTDAMIEFRLHLDDLGLADPPAARSATHTPPAAGTERFYVKSHGSAAGDMMVAVADCGHNQWGGDCRRKAPRALKGITAGEGATPRELFKCSKCSKNRWRARF